MDKKIIGRVPSLLKIILENIFMDSFELTTLHLLTRNSLIRHAVKIFTDRKKERKNERKKRKKGKMDVELKKL